MRTLREIRRSRSVTTLGAALWRVGTVAVFAAAPIAVLGWMLVIGMDTNSLAVDFHHELYPQAEQLLAGVNPYPTADFEPIVGGNLIWPPLAALWAAPFTLLPLGIAEVGFAALGVALFVAALWVVGLRDWRVYGACFLWPQVAGEMRVAHLTSLIALLVALAWRERHRRLVVGIAVGLAVALKFFVWPLAVWLAARRHWQSAGVAAVIAAASFLSVLPFAGPVDYTRALLRLGEHFDQDAYTVFGLLSEVDVSDTPARVVGVAVGLALLLGTWRFRSLALAIAAALALSPIVWLDYFALLAIPLAIARPRLSPVWLLPLATWGAAGTGLGIGDPVDIARVLVAFAVVVAVCVRSEPRLEREPRGRSINDLPGRSGRPRSSSVAA